MGCQIGGQPAEFRAPDTLWWRGYETCNIIENAGLIFWHEGKLKAEAHSLFCAGIVKRVALLLLVGLVLGTVLFYVGLELSGIAR